MCKTETTGIRVSQMYTEYSCVQERELRMHVCIAVRANALELFLCAAERILAGKCRECIIYVLECRRGDADCMCVVDVRENV